MAFTRQHTSLLLKRHYLGESMRRILLIEPHHDIAKRLSECMAHLGHEVALAENTTRALSIYTPGAFDLVVLSFFLSNKEIVETASDIRRQSEGQPILLLSGFQPYVVKRGKKGLISACLTMPFGDKELAAMIVKLCGAP